MSSGTSFWQHLDGQLEGAIASPTPLVICPGNGLVLYKRQFSESEIARLTPLVHSEAYQRTRKQHSSYGLLNVLLEHMGEPLSDRAPVLQQAVWERPQQYLPLAEQAYAARCPDEATVQDADWMQCQMLRGEWERRLSRFEQAGQRFERLAPLVDKVFEGDEPRRERFRRIIAQQRNLVAARSPFSARIEQEQRSTSRVPSRPVSSEESRAGRRRNEGAASVMGTADINDLATPADASASAADAAADAAAAAHKTDR